MGKEELQHTLDLKKNAETYINVFSYSLSMIFLSISFYDAAAHLFVFSCLPSLIETKGY